MDLDDDDADVTPPVAADRRRAHPGGTRVVVGRLLRPARPGSRRSSRTARCASTDTRCSSRSTRTTAASRWSEPRDWPDGARSPGILTVATFEQAHDTDFEEWLSFWHGHQSPMSEAIQPRCRYVRNLVVRPLEPGNPPWRGIVEEAWPSAEHVTDPMLFYCAGGDRDGHVDEHRDDARSRDQAHGPEHLAEHDDERVDHEDGGFLMGRFQPRRARRGPRPLRRGGRPMCARRREWREWSELFTEDAEYLEHTFGRFKGREQIYEWIQPLMNAVAELRDDRRSRTTGASSTRNADGGSARSRTGSGIRVTAACTRRTT